MVVVSKLWLLAPLLLEALRSQRGGRLGREGDELRLLDAELLHQELLLFAHGRELHTVVGALQIFLARDRDLSSWARA